MINISEKYHSFRVGSPWTSFFLLLFFVFCGLFVGQLLGLAIVMLLFNFSVSAIQEIIMDVANHPEVKLPIYIIQGFTALGAFIVAPLLFMQIWVKRSSTIFFKNGSINGNIYLATVFIVISFMFVNSLFIEWNAQLTLPDFLKPFEDWAYEKEQQAKLLTEFLTRFDNFAQFLLGIFIIAIIPAIGEELLFRGLIQNQFHAISKNIHIGIWVSGFLFSAMHLQFYGFLPRMLLGVLFGYMYYWSGNLIIPILAHFVNNAFTLTMLYLYQISTIDYDLETETSVPWYVIILCVTIGAMLLFYFKNYFRTKGFSDG